jgi:cytoskeletal protein RodZ
MTATETAHPHHRGAPDPDSIQAARRDRRRRTIYASLAGWTLLGAAGVGLVACSSSAQATGTTAAAATSSAAASSSATSATTSAASTEAATEATASAAAEATQAATSAAPAAANTSTYQDGTYTATGTYTSPGGTEEVTITLTIADDVITAATAEGGATRPPSSQYQGEFVDNFAALIIGKDIADVSLDKVAGSSLTSGGFNAAVETIKTDAQA